MKFEVVEGKLKFECIDSEGTSHEVHECETSGVLILEVPCEAQIEKRKVPLAPRIIESKVKVFKIDDISAAEAIAKRAKDLMFPKNLIEKLAKRAEKIA